MALGLEGFKDNTTEFIRLYLGDEVEGIRVAGLTESPKS